MKPHLYQEENGLIHDCEETCFGRDTVVVWTKCGKDVPVGMSFRSWDEKSDCKECKPTTRQ